MNADMIALLVVAGVLAYLVSLKLHPWTACGRCRGSGKNALSTRRRFGSCKRCGGTGRKPRLGTRFLARKEG